MKPWYQSKTLWFNALVAALAALEASASALAPLLGEATYPLLVVTLAAGNAMLRTITSEGLSK